MPNITSHQRNVWGKKTMIAVLVHMEEGEDVSYRKYFAVKGQKQSRLC